MSLYEEIQINKKLPMDEDYEEELKEIEFYRVSYDATGIDYTQGSAPDGRIIHKLECEEKNDYAVRCKQTPTRSYVSSILNKYNSAIFRNEPTRATSSPVYQQLISDADGYGMPLNMLMKKALLQAQIDGCSYLLADNTEATTEILTIAQKQQSNARPYIRLVKKESVVAYTEVEEKLLEAIVLLEDEMGSTFARYMNDTQFCDITLDQKSLRVTGISDLYASGYTSIPLVEIEPFEDAQSKQISYAQRSIVNLLSLLQTELNESVFTKWILSGTKIDNEQQKITWSGKRVLVLESDQAKLQLMGADHGCADSLRKEIDLEEKNLYYAAGFGKPNVEPTNLSGISRLIAMEDFFMYANQLKLAIESAENAIMQVIADAEGYEYIPVVYSSKYIADDLGEELSRLRDLLALDIPRSFKNLAIKDYINRFYSLSDEQLKAIEAELGQNSV